MRIATATILVLLLALVTFGVAQEVIQIPNAGTSTLLTILVGLGAVLYSFEVEHFVKHNLREQEEAYDYVEDRYYEWHGTDVYN